MCFYSIIASWSCLASSKENYVNVRHVSLLPQMAEAWVCHGCSLNLQVIKCALGPVAGSGWIWDLRLLAGNFVNMAMVLSQAVQV